MEVVDLAHAFPETSIIVNHVGGPLGVGRFASRSEETMAQWRIGLAELSRCSNVYMKVGGLGMLYFGFDFHRRDMPPSSIDLAATWRPYFDECLHQFGPARCMFESNFPVDKQSCCYATLVNAYKRLADSLSETEKAAYFCDTAARVYDLPGELLM
jgi:L-fuconolactonase